MNARAESSFTCRIQHFNNNNDNKTYKKENKKPHSQILASRRAHPKKSLPARSPAAIPTKNSVIQEKYIHTMVYFTVRNTYIRTSHCVPTTIVRTLKRTKKNKKEEDEDEKRRKKTTRKQTYHNYLYIQSANSRVIFRVQYMRCIAGR